VATRTLLAIGALLLIVLGAGPVLGLRGGALIGVELAAIGAIVVTDRFYGARFGRWLQGARGEERVGAVLEGLANEDWHSIHDVSLGHGNVDHVVIGTGGVFAIETKSRRGRIRIDRIDRRFLKQAYAERKLLERVTGMKAAALLVFSDAWLVGSVPARREGVTVIPARMLAGYLRRRRPVMSQEEAQDVAERLAGAVDQALGVR
jgi:hypothetical protein